MQAKRIRHLWWFAGLVAGTGVGVWLWRRGVSTGSDLREWNGPGDAAQRVQRAFDADPELRGRVRVRGISEGVVELTGRVPRHEQRDRAAAMAYNVPGIHTVVSRVVLEVEELRLEENPTSPLGGAPPSGGDGRQDRATDGGDLNGQRGAGSRPR